MTLVGHAESSVPDRFARSAGAALGKVEIGWLFRHLPALLRHFWLCSVGTELPAWPTRQCFLIGRRSQMVPKSLVPG